MILCRWRDEWGIAQRLQPSSSGCSIAIRNAVGPLFQRFGFVPYVHNTYWHRSFDQMSDILFYPQLRWQGFQVTPVCWNRESTEPLVLCRMETQSLGAKSDKEYERLVADMRTMGWHWDLMEGGHKYIHVDELEKIDGPPPEGAF